MERLRMKKICLITTLLALALALSGCGADKGETAELFAMDTLMSLTAYGENAETAVADAQREINRLEALLSRTRSESDVARLNAAQGAAVTVDAEVRALLETALEVCVATGGAFDITVAPVASAWGFTENAYRVPGQAELDALLPHVGPGNVTMAGESVTLAPGTKIDLGGIAKGYASDRVADILEQYEIPAAVVSLGGNVYVRGTKTDGSAWRVGIQDPNKPDGYLGILALEDAFAITSGGYQRYFEQNGKIYHHIIDPATGYPAYSGLASVTVVTGREAGGNAGARCDAYSTALFVMGEEKALDFWRKSDDAFELLLVTVDGRILVTEGLAEQFQQEKDNDYVYKTVAKAKS